MAKNLDQTGVLQVNGAWATSVKYESEVLGARAGMVDLRFMQGRSEIARVSLLSEEVSAVIGEKNAATITRHLAGDADKYLAVVKGELRGTRLSFQEVRLEENAIELGRGRIVAPEPDSMPPNPASGVPQDRAAPEGNTTGTQSRDSKAQYSEARTQFRPVPPHIVAKYLVKRDQYYFDDQTVAFVDRGTRLTVQTQNSAVIKDLIEIVKSREWHEIHVTGTKAFKREVWKEAHAAGLQVTGCAPSAIELEAADRARARRDEANSPREEKVSSRPEAVEPTPEGRPPDRPAPRRAADPARGVVYGTLIDHGVAPYRHDTSKSASYFVTIKEEGGTERTHWGVGLADAMRQAKSTPQIGDEIGLRRIGSTPVTVLGRNDGEETAPSPIAAKRHHWQIEKAEVFRDVGKNPEAAQPPESTRSVEASATDLLRVSVASSSTSSANAEAAAAIRSARTTREELQLKFPELNKAVFQHLASHDQFAQAYVQAGLIRESDRAQVIAQMRERLAGQLERGILIKEPNNQQVNTIIRRSVNRVASDIGRAPVELGHAPPSPVRDETPVRA